MRCCIFGAGDYHGERLDLVKDSYVIAADGGLLHTARYGIQPGLAVGDFDSLGSLPQGVKTLTFPVMKDDTDMALAVKEALDYGCDSFYLFGGMGGRLDHTLANMSLVLSLAGQGKSAYLIGKDCVITSLCAGEKLWFSSACRGTLSVFAAGDRAEGVTLSGLLYPFTNGCLTNERALGVSNHFTAEAATVTLTSGKLYLLWDTVDNPLPERTK